MLQIVGIIQEWEEMVGSNIHLTYVVLTQRKCTTKAEASIDACLLFSKLFWHFLEL